MKRFVFLALVLAILSSCSNSEDKGDINQCFNVLRSAELCEQIENEIPCGLKFGMTHEEMDSCLDRLSKDPNNGIHKVGSYYHYMFKANNNKYECMILGFPFGKNVRINDYSFVFDNSELHFSGNVDELFKNMKEEYKDLDFAFCEVGDGEKVHDKVYCWGYQNLAIILTDNVSLTLHFYNAPVEKPTSTLDFISRFAKDVGNSLKQDDIQKKQIGKITNSPFDGSVHQVKKYLKTSLKDPDSYESISWGKLQKNSNGYSVYHKYRAKNSFGGFVVEEHIFNISEDGTITISQ